ncbi:MAG: ComEC/Rec2 family competence protein [bacterium]|nr:ComEC/Rec2 family competence protein [bacterium]
MSNKINIHDLAFWLCLFFLIGITLTTLFTGSFYLIILAVCLVSFYFLLIKKKKLAWLVLFVIAGAVYYQLFSYFQFKNINIPFGKEGEFSGLVEGVRGGATQELKLSLDGDYRGDISVRLSPYPEFKYGDVVKISGKINKPDEQYNNYFLSRGIFGQTNFPKIELIEKNKGNFIKAKLFLFKEKIMNVFKSSLPKEKSAFLAGITIGAREDFSKEFKDKMSMSGTTHLVALSGYNISVIVLAVGLLFNSFFGSAISFYLSVLTITLFVLMAGAEASVVRAAIMGTIGLFAIQTERLFNPRNAIVIAAFIMALFNPRVLVFDIGFQLSFAALLGIVYLAPSLKNIFNVESGGFLSWKENAITTSAAQIMALPILLSSFGVFSLTSILANILILEFIPITMSIGFAMAFLGLVSGFLAKTLGVLVNIFITYEFFIINIFSRFSIPLKTEGLSFYFWVIYYALIFVFVLFYKNHDEKGI